jgi:hypothetical protein
LKKCHLLSLNLCLLYAFITVVYVCYTGNMNADLECKLWCLFVTIYLSEHYRSKRKYFKELQFSILHGLINFDNFSQNVLLQEESKDPFIFFWYVPFHVWAILAVFSNLILTDRLWTLTFTHNWVQALWVISLCLCGLENFWDWYFYSRQEHRLF